MELLITYVARDAGVEYAVHGRPEISGAVAGKTAHGGKAGTADRKNRRQPPKDQRHRQEDVDAYMDL